MLRRRARDELQKKRRGVGDSEAIFAHQPITMKTRLAFDVGTPVAFVTEEL